MIPRQTFTDTIQRINKTLSINFCNKLSKKTILIISAIILGSIASLKVILKLEKAIATDRLLGSQNSRQDIVRISRKEFNELNKFSIKELNINICLYQDRVIKFINAYLSSRDELYPKLSTLFNAKNDPSHPFHGKKYHELIFMYSSDSILFDTVKDCVPNTCRWPNSIVISEEMFNKKLLEIAESKFTYHPEVSIFRNIDFQNLKNKDKMFKDKTYTIGALHGYTYVAHDKDSLKKYNSYIKKSIKEEDQ